MRKWEYKVIEIPELDEQIAEVLNSLGDVGWELLETTPMESGQGRLAILKRPAPGLPQC